MAGTESHAASSDLHTVESARVILLAFFNVAAAWRLSPKEQQVLLGASTQTCRRWRGGKVASPLSAGTLERLGYIFNTYAALRLLNGIQERADGWLRQPNSSPLFGGGAALSRMLGGKVEDLKVVAEYLSSQLGGDFS